MTEHRKRLLAALAFAAIVLPVWWLPAAANRTPGELIRYAETRLIGHPKLESIAGPILSWARDRFERPVSGLPAPEQLRGAGPRNLPPQLYDDSGKPLPVPASKAAATQATRLVSSVAELERALEEAGPGDVIELAPGQYRIARRLRSAASGESGRPIVLRAATPGAVTLDSMATEALVIDHPYWLVENLHFVGRCSNDDNCEHAIHVVGNAQATVLRNLRLVDFNAAIKVNGVKGNYPDNGLVQFSHLYNTRVRDTTRPVTPIDIVAASGWIIADNLIADFARNSGPSYGVFMKGGGRRGRIERNLIVCRLQVVVPRAIQIGLSFGGGGTDANSMRRNGPGSEHDGGLAANNIVAHCPDFGIDVHRATNTHLAFNTVVNTYGIDVRRSPASAAIYGNMIEGTLRARDGAVSEAQNNEVGPIERWLSDADRLQPSWREPPAAIPVLPGIDTDFCGRPRTPETLPGALSNVDGCTLITDTRR